MADAGDRDLIDADEGGQPAADIHKAAEAFQVRYPRGDDLPRGQMVYVFGTAAIAAGNYDIMAAVMIGGMTPPCAIALATLLFKNKFTKEERDAGPTNFIMGLAFITEGAIPFAASDPLHVLPSCIIGSALAGALSMAFHCTLMAPHGGIFVFPVVGNAVMYLVALVAGTVVSALLLGVLKKKVTT